MRLNGGEWWLIRYPNSLTTCYVSPVGLILKFSNFAPWGLSAGAEWGLTIFLVFERFWPITVIIFISGFADRRL